MKYTKSRTPSAVQFKVIKRHYELKDERLIIKNRDKTKAKCEGSAFVWFNFLF